MESRLSHNRKVRRSRVSGAFFGLPMDQRKELLVALEAQLTVARELVLRRFVEAWLEGRRDEHKTLHQWGNNG